MENLMDRVFNNLSQCGDKSGHTDAEGFLVCSKCGQRKQVDTELNGRTYRMPIACQCVKAQDEWERQERDRKRIEEMKHNYLTDPKYYDFTFDKDDSRQPKISAVCRKYVDEWEQMKTDNIGILFYGDVGAGKSFLACCIANGLIDKFIPAMVTSFPAILRTLQGFGEERQRVYSSLKQAALLVIDDLGVERDTSTALEQVYSIIDSRLLSKKPTIFTTNLDIEIIKNPKDMTYKRIYSRVLEMCPIKLDITGTDRRRESSEQRAELARQILGVRNDRT